MILSPPIALFLLTLAAILGICWQAYSMSIFAGISCALFICFFIISVEPQKYKQFSFFSFIFLLFFALGVIRYQQSIAAHQSAVSDIYNKKTTLMGYIEAKEKTQNPQYPISLILDTHNRGRFKIFLPESFGGNVGDTAIFSDLWIQPNTNKAFELYLIKEQLIAMVFVKEPVFKISKSHSNLFAQWIASTKTRLLSSLQTRMTQLNFTLIESILLGHKATYKESSDLVKNTFKIWGIVHQLARSGLHVVIFIMLWTLLLSRLPIPFFVKQLVLIAILGIYTVLSWSSISFIRALITFGMYKICTFTTVPIQPLYLFIWTCILVLFYNPLHLFFLDFQLSFALTFALAWLNMITIQRNKC